MISSLKHLRVQPSSSSIDLRQIKFEAEASFNSEDKEREARKIALVRATANLHNVILQGGPASPTPKTDVLALLADFRDPPEHGQLLPEARNSFHASVDSAIETRQLGLARCLLEQGIIPTPSSLGVRYTLETGSIEVLDMLIESGWDSEGALCIPPYEIAS